MMELLTYMQEMLTTMDEAANGFAGAFTLPGGRYSLKGAERIIAVYQARDAYRLWQDCYMEQSCDQALRVWVVTKARNVLMLRSRDEAPVMRVDKRQSVYVSADVEVQAYAGFPAMDVLGNRFDVSFEGGEAISRTLAAFYWHTLIPCVIEGKNDSYPDGYVLSTLAQSVYAGTYPDVDHEFQIKGRMACGGAFDLELVQRMMALQLRLMEEDPVKLWRDPCALQPNGVREYHVRRNSGDHKTNADMFLISGNVEILESAWLWTARTKDTKWLAAHIDQLEGAASLVEISMDRLDRLWSDVFYEDQVIKDGTECMSACLAAHGFGCIAELEALLGRDAEQRKFADLKERLAKMIVKPVPYGFWDERNKRFIDWLDRDGMVHDHLHLLANCLPVLFSYCTEEQRQACIALIHNNYEEYQRFPTFLSPCIQDYTPSELGVPYDLCAAGRYWCWDAAYWACLGRGDVLKKQVLQVAQQAEMDGYEMGERYDMNHIFYIDHRNWHGAEHYYEYPNVFWWVVVHDLLGVSPSMTADVLWKPQLKENCHFILEAWRFEADCTADHVMIKNLSSSHSLTVVLDPTAIWNRPETITITVRPGDETTISKE
ncbi:MAG: hypothetical protein PHY12_02045 [Eubacteriales bacterium]|nr:hypothetical protein [Eubacteriales bacterium]